MSRPDPKDVAMALISLSDDRIRAAIAEADPEDDASLERELDRAEVSGRQRDAIERVWGVRRRGRYVAGWTP